MDIDVMLRVHAAGAEVTEVDIGRNVHDIRDPRHYAAMAEQIFGFFLGRQPVDPMGEVVILAETAEGVIRTALGDAAAKRRGGARVTVALADGPGDGARALAAALAAYPTARIKDLGDASGIRPGPHSAWMTLVAEAGAAMQCAKALETRFAPARPVYPWQIPDPSQPGPDIAAEIAEGRAIKRAALTRIGAASQDAPREMFLDCGADTRSGS